jgi:folate-binding protein YgfZ
LGKFIVADRVTLENVTQSVAVLHIGQDPAALQALNLCSPDQCVGVISCRRISEAGTHAVVKRDVLDTVTERCRTLLGEPITPPEYRALRWQAGVPEYPTELNEDVILTECGMRQAVSFTKGCYVGQEVLERSDAIGKLPRTLERLVLAGKDTVASGANLVAGDGATLGKVVSSSAHTERAETLVFALLRTGKYSRGDVVRCGDRLGTIV